MSKSTIAVIVILAVNLIISVFFMILGIFRPSGKKLETTLYGVFFLVCPVIGVTCFGVYWLLMFLFSSTRFDSESLSFSTDRTQAVLPSDEQAELNYISIQDALVMDDTTSLRQLLLNVLKGKSVLEAPSIAQAISSSDVEASHYAATAVTNYLSEFRANAQTKMYYVKQMPNNVPTLNDAISYITPVLQAKIMDDIEQRSYVYMLESMMDDMFSNNKWHLFAQNYLDITDLLIDIEDYSRARVWVNRALDCREGELDTFKCAIHLYYAIQSRDELFAIIKEVKNSDIVIDKEVLEFIRMVNTD